MISALIDVLAAFGMPVDEVVIHPILQDFGKSCALFWRFNSADSKQIGIKAMIVKELFNHSFSETVIILSSVKC